MYALMLPEVWRDGDFVTSLATKGHKVVTVDDPADCPSQWVALDLESARMLEPFLSHPNIPIVPLMEGRKDAE